MSASADSPLLILFDVDGTLLLRASREHAQALYAALHEVLGISDPEHPKISAAGRTDGEIARLIALGHGVEADRIDEAAGALRESCCRHFAKLCPADMTSYVAPGIGNLLARLDAAAGVKLGLVTGNYEPVARLKMSRAGLAPYFPRGQGAFGSDSEDRSALPPLARRRAGHHPRERTIVIGDTPRDIACARADGVRVFAVATGPYGPDELSEADAVARDARELGSLLAREL